ncbi:MAG: hypothetical protein EBU31_05925 [Proteobacteria bacterium]|nr:hypothetical protein [Pseudomonadota bacterium]
MSVQLTSSFVIGPRFEMPISAPVRASFRTQLRRAVRSLLGQRGGVMLMSAWGLGTEVRIECTVSGATTEIVVSTDDEVTAAMIRSLCDARMCVGADLLRGSCAAADAAGGVIPFKRSSFSCACVRHSLRGRPSSPARIARAA